MLQWMLENKLKILKAATIAVILVAVFGIFNYTNAQSVANPDSTINQGLDVIEQPLGLSTLDIRTIIANIIKVILGLIGIILVVLLLYAGYLWMTAGGNEEQIVQSKNIIKNAVIGLAIILSAYSIVAFVLKMLGVNGGDLTNTNVQPPITTNLTGSGALGKVVKDHYPARDQKNIPRNTKIVVTFFKPVSLASFVEDTNNSGFLGDCKAAPKKFNLQCSIVENNASCLDSNNTKLNCDVNSDDVFGDCLDANGKDLDCDENKDGNLGDCFGYVGQLNWNTDCDKVKTNNGKLSDSILNVKKTGTGESVTGLVVMAASSTNPTTNITGVYTIVLKPIIDTTVNNGGYLGSESQDTQYTVQLGTEMRMDDAKNNNPKLFPLNPYYWNFTVGTFLDLTPPQVSNVFPESITKNSKGEPKNSVIQISFSEPVSPIGLQGDFKTTSTKNYFYTQEFNNIIHLQTASSTKPLGNFNLVNNYQIVEFTPSTQCAVNACGNPIYCLPVCDVAGATCNNDNYNFILKAARTMTANSFESVPFTGIEDLAGNALDGNGSGNVQVATLDEPIFSKWATPDNYYWTFKINNKIDATAPYLTNIEPGVGAENISKNAPLKMFFSKRMRVEPLYSIDIKEDVAQADKPINYEPICKVPLLYSDSKTVEMRHCPFLEQVSAFYMPVITSAVEDVNFNCFYAGVGPKENTGKVCDPTENKDTNNCCAVVPGQNDFCCNGAPSSTNVNACVGKIINDNSH